MKHEIQSTFYLLTADNLTPKHYFCQVPGQQYVILWLYLAYFMPTAFGCPFFIQRFSRVTTNNGVQVEHLL